MGEKGPVGHTPVAGIIHSPVHHGPVSAWMGRLTLIFSYPTSFCVHTRYLACGLAAFHKVGRSNQSGIYTAPKLPAPVLGFMPAL